MKHAFTVLLLIMFANIQASDLIKKLSPEITVLAKFYIGEKVFQSSMGYTKSCIVPKKEFKRTVIKSNHYIYKQGIPICKDKKKDRLYKSNYTNYKYALSSGKYPVSLKKSKNGYTICQKFLTKEGCVKGISEQDIIVDENYFIASNNYPSRSITYMGKSKSILKFLFEEEYSGASAGFDSSPMSAFVGKGRSLNFEVDAEESSTILFMGGIFEIIEFDSSSIVIKPIKDFGNQEWIEKKWNEKEAFRIHDKFL